MVWPTLGSRTAKEQEQREERGGKVLEIGRVRKGRKGKDVKG